MEDKLKELRNKITIPCTKAQTVTIVAEASTKQLSGESFAGAEDDRDLESDEIFVKTEHGGVVEGEVLCIILCLCPILSGASCC